METKELKFLLKLLGCSNYRASLSGSVFKTFKGKDKICRNLGDRNLVDFSREIATVKILSPGQALLKLDPAELPITDQERKVLEKLSKTSGKIIPSKITVSSLKSPEKEEIFKNLSDRGLIEVELKIKRTKAEVWLTERGIEYLRDDYSPKGAANISLDLLNNYVRFLRKTLKVKPEQVSTSAVHSTESGVETIINITDEEILQTIQKLDKELGTDNYLPIFHLRQKLQPPLTRDELDKALYRLQRNDQIEFSTLLDPKPYTPEQVDAGIQQNVGGSLFFISVN
ncbi:transcription factor RcaD [Fischerella thermalis]|uniref:transcription factor RcaD n=1 Tax=Fischerella thermalis TaxID=372787 RepID=UPI000C80548F|nr:transcription factor RcaD [Fischerella thermalis]PLZ23659.1 transcription factor RcaD [Fischerella thermalis WC341]PLZ27183.1 transcription factor RcaD [Fischerella thermalis WC559]PLZ29579.1 transcription factor RcaD [Fischerella thermalis WC558]PLZ34454.1 transcription factor RcaD [Fischerella thermalis WC542]PLZ57248.1 transcription factor RcaD [Fischerella thermalis WC442]